MSEEDVDETEETEPAGPDDPDGPDLEDEDLVEVDEDLAAAVAGKTAESEDEEEEISEESEDTDDTSKSATETLTTGTSVGDLYCNALGMGATVARQQKGSGVDDREESIDEYSDLAKQLDLDDFVNEWVEEHGAADQLTPGQGIAIGTAMFAMAVMMDDPAIAENLGQEEAGT